MSLEELAKNRSQILLCEAAAWLHDMGKCDDDFLLRQSDKLAINNLIYNQKAGYKKAHSALIDPNPSVDLLNEKTTLIELIENSEVGSVDNQINWLIRLIGRCHQAAHIEKEDAYSDKKGASDKFYQSTAFGYENPNKVLQGLTAKLQAMFVRINSQGWFSNDDTLAKSLSKHTFIRNTIRETFLEANGDTRRPQNDIHLWDWSKTAAALYKAGIAQAMLGKQENDLSKIRWRLLSIRFDFAQFQKHVQSIPAWLARRAWLNDGLNRVRSLLEVEYPLATEVYRDENGSIFLAPDIPDLLELTDPQGESLESLIGKALNFQGELILSPDLDQISWWGQPFIPKGEKNRASYNDEIPPIAARLKDPVYAIPDAAKVAAWWETALEKTRQVQICTVSAVRPQGPSQEGRNRKISDYWMHEANGRAAAWLKGTHSTIWIDEVSDDTGRVALLVSKFNLDNWLNGQFVDTLRYWPSDNGKTAGINDKLPFGKNSSFARLNRIWETTAAFWQDIEKDLNTAGGILGESRPRIILRTNPVNLPSNYTYELRLNNINLSLVHAGNGLFYTAENLKYSASLLNRKTIAELKQLLTGLIGTKLQLYIPSGYGEPSKEVSQDKNPLKLEAVYSGSENPALDSYAPSIIIQNDAGHFMALLPASQALEVVKIIKQKYEEEIGRVRNRLPLVLGLVFARRRVPFPAIVDAGRRLLEQPTAPENWLVSEIIKNDAEIALSLKRNNQSLNIKVPVLLADGKTPDNFYPYWKLLSKADPVSGREGFYTGPNEKWVHVRDLVENDSIEVYPSRFDFDYLDTAARRFELYYKDGQRAIKSAQTARPYYLENIEKLETTWKALDNAETTQIKALERSLESIRQDWGADGTEAFKTFALHALNNVEWKTPPTDLENLREAVVSGLVSDTVELYTEILKRKS